MRVAILGGTRALLGGAQAVNAAGIPIPLVATIKGRDHHGVTAEDFMGFALAAGADFYAGTNIVKGDGVAILKAARCDVALSINWPTMIGPEACGAFPLGILNVHLGDLPRYRGNATPNWAIINGEDHVGLCVHRMAPDGIDSGPVLLRTRLPLTGETYIGDVYDWFERQVPELLVEAVRALQDGSAHFEEQSSDPADWLRCYPRKPEDAAIEWSESAESIHRLIRASSRPFDGAFTALEDGRRLSIWRAERVKHRGPFLAVPGQVLYREQGDPVIACGDDALRLTDVSMAGDQDNEDARGDIGASLRNRLR